MDRTREQLEKPVPGSSQGTGGEMRQLHQDATASAQELREFISRLKGRSPQEMLGEVANSSLVQATVHATIACAVLLIVGTLIPYSLGWGEQPKEAAAAETKAAAAPLDKSSAEPTDSATAATDTATSSEPDLAGAARAMGMDETITAEPGRNPLDADKKLDQLLDGLE